MRTKPIARTSVALFAALLLGCGGIGHRPTTHAASSPTWATLDEALAEAAREGRPMVLSIQADWCHWCHVMNDTTYRDPEVIALLEARFVVAREEADARPDLAERYAEYGWPATIVFAPDGTEILALRGHRSSAALLEILRTITGDLDTGRPAGASLPPRAPSRGGAPVALEALRASLTAQLDDLYDEAMGGWGTPQKYPFEAPIEHTFLRARLDGDAALRDRALFTLSQQTALLDPIWGGMYQYSEQGDWQHPHYERIASVQAGAIEGFALGYRATGDAAWRARAVDVVRYVRTFLTREDGAFFASQDADLRVEGSATTSGADYAARSDADRRALGIPRIDERVFATTNGVLIAALARLSEIAPELGTLDDAMRAADAVIASSCDADGLFRHEAGVADERRYLADQVAMARALFAIEQAGGGLRYRALSRRTLDATLAAFSTDDGPALVGSTAEATHGTLAVSRVPPIDNALAASLALSFARLGDDDVPSGGDEARALAILGALADPASLAPLGRKVGEILLALEAAHAGVIRFSIVGAPADPRTAELTQAVLAVDEPLRVIERSEPGEGRYPSSGEPVVYVCARDSCSFPFADPGSLAADVARFLTR